MNWRFWNKEERLRRQAAVWFARQQGPDADRAALEQWLAADPAHARAFDNITTTWDLAEELRDRPIARRLELSAKGKPEPRSVLFWGVPLATAAIAIAIIAWMVIPQFGLIGDGEESSRQIASTVGEIRNVRLADGSTVILDTDTTLQVAYSSGSRRIMLIQGRARFAVAHDTDRPFIVDAGTGVVTARGTVFDVSRFDSRFDVLLLSGAIDIELPSNSSAVGSVRRTEHLNPGEQLSFIQGSLSPLRRREPPSLPNWPSGMLEFEDTPLRDVVAEINRYGRVKILLGSPGVSDLRVTGAYRARDVEHLARSLATIFSLNLIRTRDGNFVLESPD